MIKSILLFCFSGLFALVRVFFSFVFKGSVAKFFLFFALYFIIKEMIPIIGTLIKQFQVVTTLFNNLPDSVWYFLNLFLFADGFKLMTSAYFTRFIIRRIPLIG